MVIISAVILLPTFHWHTLEAWSNLQNIQLTINVIIFLDKHKILKFIREGRILALYKCNMSTIEKRNFRISYSCVFLSSFNWFA